MSRRSLANPPVPDEDVETDKARREREAYERACAEDREALHSARRTMFDAFRLWTVCDRKRCRRNRRCSGDTDECVMKRWRRFVPQEMRSDIFKVVQFMRDGMTATEAIAAAETDLKAHGVSIPTRRDG